MSDYAEHCTKVDTLRRIVHDACLRRDWDEVKRQSEALITEAVEIKMFADHKLEERMKLDQLVDRVVVEQSIRVRNVTKINLTVDMSTDDVFDFIEKLHMKMKSQDWNDLKELINALEKING